MKCPRGCNDFGTERGEMVPMSSSGTSYLHCFHCGHDANFCTRPESQIHRGFSGLENENPDMLDLETMSAMGFKTTKYS